MFAVYRCMHYINARSCALTCIVPLYALGVAAVVQFHRAAACCRKLKWWCACNFTVSHTASNMQLLAPGILADTMTVYYATTIGVAVL